MHNHNESDRLSTPFDEKIPLYPHISQETIDYLSRRFPGGIDISASVDELLQNPENSILRDETIYPRWFGNK